MGGGGIFIVFFKVYKARAGKGRQRASEGQQGWQGRQGQRAGRGPVEAFSLIFERVRAKKSEGDQQRPAEAAKASKGWQGQAVGQRGPTEGQRRLAGPKGQRAGEGQQRHFHWFLNGLKQTRVKTMFSRRSFLEKYKGCFSLVFKGF